MTSRRLNATRTAFSRRVRGPASRQRLSFALISAVATAWLPGLHAVSEDYFDRVERALSFRSMDGQLRGRIGGSFDVEGYVLEQPSPGLLFSRRDAFVTPRLTATLDAQVGSDWYFFAQSRFDRRFDPSDHGWQARVDEWAIRYTPGSAKSFGFQVGKFATVVGNWVARHGSWKDPFITAPVPYENLMGIWDVAAAIPGSKLLKWAHLEPLTTPEEENADKDRRLPIVWGPSYTTGAALAGRWSKLDYAVELKNASLSSRPSVWSPRRTTWEHPTVSGRIGFRPNLMWNLGVSASEGVYLQPGVESSFYGAYRLRDYKQQVLAQDLSFAWHHLQVWAELFSARFTLPEADDARTTAYYIEAKYKFTPQLFGALRWNHQLFGRIRGATGDRLRWGRELRRIDVGPTYRFSPHTQVKVQYSVQHEDLREGELGHTFAAQFTVRF